MKKYSFYGIEWEELETVKGILRNNGYHFREDENSSATIFDHRDKIVGEIYKIGGLVFSGIPNLNSYDSDLEKVLDKYLIEQEGRDPSPSAKLLRSSKSNT